MARGRSGGHRAPEGEGENDGIVPLIQYKKAGAGHLERAGTQRRAGAESALSRFGFLSCVRGGGESSQRDFCVAAPLARPGGRGAGGRSGGPSGCRRREGGDERERGADRVGHRFGLHPAGGVLAHMHRRHSPPGHLGPLARAVFLKEKFEAEAGLRHFADRARDAYDVTTAQGTHEGAGRFAPRPAEAQTRGRGAHHGQVQGAKPLMFAHLHPTVEIGKVHNPGRVGLMELDPARNGKSRTGHAGRVGAPSVLSKAREGFAAGESRGEPRSAHGVSELRSNGGRGTPRRAERRELRPAACWPSRRGRRFMDALRADVFQGGRGGARPKTTVRFAGQTRGWRRRAWRGGRRSGNRDCTTGRGGEAAPS